MDEMELQIYITISQDPLTNLLYIQYSNAPYLDPASYSGNKSNRSRYNGATTKTILLQIVMVVQLQIHS